MSLQRLLVYSPLAALVAVCLAVRVASDQATHARASAPPAKASAAGLQSPRSLETPSADGMKTGGAKIGEALPRPPADVPDLTGAGAASASIAATATLGNGTSGGGERNPAKTTTAAKAITNNSPDASQSFGDKQLSARKTSGQAIGAQPPLRKPESWTPPVVYGPPLPIERVHVQKQAHQLRKDLEAGRITLVVDTRDGEQLEHLERNGIYCWPTPPPGVSVRSERQRNVLAGTTEDSTLLPPASSGLQLASRGGEWERTAPNPADDPDFNPCALPPSPLLLRLLTTLAGHSTPSHPLQILSLLRPPYRMGGYVHVGPANPHSMGLAVDIGAYGGYAIRQADPEACIHATLALLRDLPPGRYRLGLPKAPEGGWDLPPALVALLNRPAPTVVSGASIPALDKSALLAGKSVTQTAAQEVEIESEPAEVPASATACAISALYGLYASSAKPAWPFFPPPFTQIVANESQTEDGDTPEMPQSTNARAEAKTEAKTERSAKSTRAVLRYQNEAYAPEADLTDVRLRKALEQARKRGVDVVAMFPDGADHIHVDVRQNP